MVTSFKHYNDVTDRHAGKHVAVLFYLFHRVGTGYERYGKWNPSLVSSGDRKISTRGPTVPVGNEACRLSTEQWTRGLGFFWKHWTPMIDSFSHIPDLKVRYSTISVGDVTEVDVYSQ